MKKTILLSVSFLLGGMFIISFSPITCVQDFWGTKTLYTPLDTAVSALPTGYEPVFVNYVGRHGARHLTNLNSCYYLQNVLDKSYQVNQLTPAGIKLRIMIQRFLKVEKPADMGLLSQTGCNELYGIGRRMAQHYPSLFGASVSHQYKVVTTPEERTRQSAHCFIRGLGFAMNNAHISVDTMDTVQLRFYDVCAAYNRFERNGSWTIYMRQLQTSEKGKRIDEQIINAVFKEDFANRILRQQWNDTINKRVVAYTPERINDAIFGIASIEKALNNEIEAAGYALAQMNISSLFTCEQMKWLGLVNTADDFLKKGPGTDENGIQVKDAVPLLVDFINTTDNFVNTGEETAVLRFAHAETMAPLAALMDINGAATATTDILNLDKVWKANITVCFSANLQWILYRNKQNAGDMLVKILYNEKPVKIPVVTNRFPYYKWDDVRAYYVQKLNSLHVALSDDMYQYLVNL